MPILPKSKPKFIQQHHNLPTLSKFQEPPTLSKLHHYIKKKKIHYKNATKPTFPNITNPTMPPKFQNNQMTNISPWNFQWNMQQYFSKQRNQRKTHLGVYMTIWSMGPRVLKKSIIIMPLKCWIIFLTWDARKEDPLEGEAILMQRKWIFENGFHQNGCGTKMLKTQRSKEILMEMDEGELRNLEKCFL